MVTISRISFASAIIRTVLSAAIVALPVTSARADAPVGTVVSGEASFDYNGNKTTITAGNNAIIEYPKFNIDRNETVQFVQPTDTSRVLNRITGGDPSSILGNLQANGIVYFVNPAGIYFGQHATIDVGQFYAAAGNLSNSNFLAGRDNFERLSGQVHNEGTINASAIHLIGQNVRNTGALNSPAGLVMLAAGEDVLIGRRGEHVFVNATANSHPDTVKTGVENTGNINAEGGRALLAAGDLYALAVQNSGVIKARNVELAGQGSGEVWNRGTIDASSSDATGGRIEMTGQYVGLSSESTIDASGATGGGEILIGGDYQGANADIRNATATYVVEGATIRADATTSGSGGRVIVWADETTRFHGNISATGITHGGFAEVSGKQNLLYTGLADLRSANGLTGTLLLDPDNITISSSASTITTSGSIFTAPGDGDWYLNVGDLIAQLELANTSVQTVTGNISITDDIAWTAATTLTLNSGNNIIVNEAVYISNTTSAASGLVMLAAGNIDMIGYNNIDAGNISFTAGGTISVGNYSALTARATSIILTAGQGMDIDGNIYADNISLTANTGTVSIATNARISSGTISITGALDAAAGSYIGTSGPEGFLVVDANGGDITLAGEVFAYLSSTFFNAANISVTGTVHGADADIAFVGNQAMSVGGRINIASGGSLSLASTTGTVSIASTAEIVTSDITFTGGLNIASGAALTTYRNFNVNALNRNVRIASDLYLYSTGTLAIANASDITLASRVNTNLAQSYSATGDIAITGTLETRAAGEGITLATTTGTISLAPNAEIISLGDLDFSGGLRLDTGGSISSDSMFVDGDNLDVLINTNLTLTGSLTVDNARNLTLASTIITDESQSYAATDSITLTGSLTTVNSGAGISFSSTTVSLVSASLIESADNVSITGGLNMAAGAGIYALSMTVDALGGNIVLGGEISTGMSGTYVNATGINVTGTILGAGVFTASQSMTVSGVIDGGSDQELSVTVSSGTLSLASTSTLGGLDVSITGGLDMAVGANIYSDNAVVIDANGGNLAISGNVDTRNGGTFFNANNIALTGTATGASGDFVFTGNQAMTVGGVIDAGSGGNVALASTTGTVAITSTGTINGNNINITGGLNVADGASLTTQYNSGNINIDAQNRDIAIATTLVMGSGTLGISNANNLALDTVITDDAQNYTAAGAITLTGTLQTINADQNITLTGTAVTLASTSEIDSTGTVAITGALDMASGATIRAFETTVNALGGNIAIDGGIMTGGGTFSNASAINVTGTVMGHLTFVASQTMTVGGVIDGGSDGAIAITVSAGTLSLASTSTLGGTNVSITGGLDMAAGADIYSTNAVVINANGGNLAIGGNVDTFNGGTFFNASNIALTGTVTSSAGGITFTGNQSMTIGGVIDAGSGGPVNLASTTGSVAIASTADVNGSDININGGLNVASGATLTTTYNSGSVVIDALDKDVVINTDLNLPNLSIAGARYIEIGAVTTQGNQSYRVAPDGAGAMKINGALVSEYGDISITSASDFPTTYATIFSTSPTGILISATLGNVTIGHNDTLLAYHDGSAAPDAGSITIEAGNTAALGNLSASRRINVSADQIRLDGAVYQAPAIALSAVTSLDITTLATIATAQGAHDITPPTTGSYTAATIAADSMTGDAMNSTYFPLTTAPYASVYERTEFWGEITPETPPDQEIKQNIVADEANPANRTEPEAQQLQETQRIAVDTAFQQIDAETAISAATAGQLRKLGIFPRPLTPQERNELGARFGTLRQIIPSEIRAPENYQVADGRLSEQSALAAIAAYNRAFETDDGASRLPDLQAVILKTYRDFRAANPGAPATQYVRYIDTLVPGTDDTRALHAFFEDVRALFLRIDRLGLTDNEVLVSKNVILRPLRVQGAPSALLAPLMQVSPDTGPLITASTF